MATEYPGGIMDTVKYQGATAIKTLIPILLSLFLTAGQALYFGASANSGQESSPQMVAMSQPAPAGTAASKAITSAETCVAPNQSSVIWGVEINARHIGGDEADRLAREGVLVGSDSGNSYVNLTSGNILLNPDKDTVVGVCEGKIYIGAGASVFITKSGDNVVIYDLLQTKPKQVSVTITVNKQKLVLEPGRMLVLTRQNTNDFEKLETACHYVAYKNAMSLDLHNNTVQAFGADFSIASAMVTIEPLKDLTASNNKQDKLATERLVKGAVILGDFATSTASPAQIVDTPAAAQTDTVKVADTDSSH